MNEIRCTIVIDLIGTVTFEGGDRDRAAAFYARELERAEQKGQEGVITNLTNAVEILARKNG